MARTMLLRVDLLGPSAASRERRKCTRSTRASLCMADGASVSCATKSLNDTGWPKLTRVLRPLASTISALRRGPALALSVNRILNSEVSLPGSRPQNTDTGTSCRS